MTATLPPLPVAFGADVVPLRHDQRDYYDGWNACHAAFVSALAAQAQPVQPTPLTKDQLSAALRSVDPLMVRLPSGLEEFARAVERLHGISAPVVPTLIPGDAA